MAGRLPAPKMLTGSCVISGFTRGGGDQGNSALYVGVRIRGNSRRRLQSTQSNCCGRHMDDGVTWSQHTSHPNTLCTEAGLEQTSP